MSDAGDNEVYSYWLRWQVPVCALIIIASFVTALMQIVNAKAEPLSYHDLWIPRWRYLNPVWLLLYRAFAFLCLARILLQIIIDLDGAFAFYFYTQWTFTLVMIYFALGTVVSAYGCWQLLNKPPHENSERAEFLRRDLQGSASSNPVAYKEKETKGSIKLQSRYTEDEFQQRAGFWGYLMQTTYQMSNHPRIKWVVFLGLVFWGLLVPFLTDSNFKLNMLMGCMHTLNAVFLLLDTALNNLPFPWLGLAYFVLWSCGYIIFQWIIHACGYTWWPYPFLELDTLLAPVWYLGLAVIHIPCYGMYFLIVRAKNTILHRFFPHAVLRPY